MIQADKGIISVMDWTQVSFMRHPHNYLHAVWTLILVTVVFHDCKFGKVNEGAGNNHCHSVTE